MITSDLCTTSGVHWFKTRQPMKPIKGVIVRPGSAGGKRIYIFGGLDFAHKIHALCEMGCMSGLPIMFHYQLGVQSLRILNQWVGHQKPDVVEDLARRVINDHNEAAQKDEWHHDYRGYTDWQCIFAGTLPMEVLCENHSG